MQSNAVLAILFVCAISIAHALAADTRPRLTSTLRSRSDISRRLPQLGAAGDAIPLHEQTLTGCPARTAEGNETASPARHQAAQCVSRSWSTVLSWTGNCRFSCVGAGLQRQRDVLGGAASFKTT